MSWSYPRDRDEEQPYERVLNDGVEVVEMNLYVWGSFVLAVLLCWPELWVMKLFIGHYPDGWWIWPLIGFQWWQVFKIAIRPTLPKPYVAPPVVQGEEHAYQCAACRRTDGWCGGKGCDNPQQSHTCWNCSGRWPTNAA